MCGKPKFASYSVLKTELSTNLTSVQMVFRQKLLAIRHPNKVTKSHFTCIKCADKERFKTRPKQSLAYRFKILESNYITYLLSLLWMTSVMSSAVAVIFVVNNYSAITQVVNNYNIRPEPFLNQTHSALNQEFFQETELKKNYSAHPYWLAFHSSDRML